MNKNIHVIASAKNWIDSQAVFQLEKTARLQGISQAVGMPDLHPGKDSPVGAVFLSKEWIYPNLVGNDIGCGMGFWKTSLKSSKLKVNKWASKLHLDGPWDGEAKEWLKEYNLPLDMPTETLGTIGGGNHFAELQVIKEICDSKRCEQLGLDKSFVYLLVHSGSRGVGQCILENHLNKFHQAGLKEGTEACSDYLKKHDQALIWAKINRQLIAHRFLSSLGSDANIILDIAHNTVSPKIINDQSYWLHRKGAASGEEGITIIPGSRGAASYLVEAVTKDQTQNLFSLPHGAGRKWERSGTRDRLSKKYKVEDFYKTDLGGVVICEDKALIYEEAPQAYKDVSIVVNDIVERGIVSILAVLYPILSYKKRR